MDLLEYQGKQLFAEHGVPVPEGRHATTPKEARAGGRGARISRSSSRPRSRSAAAARPAASRSPRTPTRPRQHAERDPRHGHPGPDGPRGLGRARLRHRRRVLRRGRLRPRRQEAARDALRRWAGWTSRRSPTSTPRRSRALHVDPLVGFQPFHGRRLAFESGIDADVIRPVGAMLAKLYDVFVELRRDAGRGQPADRHRRPRGDGARRQGVGRRQRARPPARDRRDAQSRRRRTRRSRWRRSAASPT